MQLQQMPRRHASKQKRMNQRDAVQVTDVSWRQDPQIPRLFRCPSGHDSDGTLFESEPRNHWDETSGNSIAVRIGCTV